MDIDIDVIDNKYVMRHLPTAKRASIVENGVLKPHLVGIYLQDMPIDDITGLSAIPYNLAENYGYKKIDILNLGILSNFQSKKQIRKLLKKTPKWDMLCNDDVIAKLFHLNKHGDTLKKVRPTSVEELADVLALIRPNKKHLIDKYISDKKSTRKELYVKVDASDLRKSHAIPYALLIVLQLHLIDAEII